MTGFDMHTVLHGGLGLLVPLWCTGLATYVVVSERHRTAALMKDRTLGKLAIRPRALGEEMRKGNVSP